MAVAESGVVQGKEVCVTLGREQEEESTHAAISNISVLRQQGADLKQDPVDCIKELQLSPVSFTGCSSWTHKAAYWFVKEELRHRSSLTYEVIM